MSTTLAEEEARAGAVFEDGYPIPARYERGLDLEYCACRQGCGLIELLDRGVLRVEGPERTGFLHRLLSQDITSLKPGEGTKAAFLSTKGHLEALLRVLVTPNAVLLETRLDRLSAVSSLLLHYKVGTPVRFAPVEVVVFGLLGLKAPEVLGLLPSSLADEAHTQIELGKEKVTVSRTLDLPGGGFILHARPESAMAVFRTLRDRGAEPAGRRALDLLRIERGRPWFGPDLGEETLLHETGLLDEYHSTTKWCYVGQETVARLEARGGHVNKAVRGLKLTEDVKPSTSLKAGEKDAGWVTTSGVSPVHGPIALGFVRREWLEIGTELEAGAARAKVVALPMEEP